MHFIFSGVNRKNLSEIIHSNTNYHFHNKASSIYILILSCTYSKNQIEFMLPKYH